MSDLPCIPIRRRTFLGGVSALAISAWIGSVRAAQDDPAKRYEGLKSEDYLSSLEVAARVMGEKFFTEGPAVDAQGRVHFTNLPTAETAQILRFDPRNRELTVFREPSNAANGLHFDAQGRLLTCEGGLQEDGRITRTDLQTGMITVLMDKYNGFPLGAPNDVALDAKGRIYFTSRLKNTDPEKGNVNAVYRIDPDGKIERILNAPDIDMPNGLVTSPDDKTLYLVESDGRADRARCIKAYDLNDNGTVSNVRVHFNFSPGRSGDGMCIDREGNLYVAAGLHKPRGTAETLDTKPGIHVIAPDGRLRAYMPTPVDTVTNCAFGGEDLKTLYVTCGPFLLHGRTQIPGKPLYRAM